MMGAAVIAETRLGHVVLEVPNWPLVHLFGAYLHVAEGMTERNVDLLAKLGEEVRQRRHYLVAADWNMWPAQVEASGFPRATQGTILRPPKGQVTCVTGRRPLSSTSWWQAAICQRPTGMTLWTCSGSLGHTDLS